MLLQLASKIHNIGLEHICKHLNSSLGLAIDMRMEGSTKIYLSTQLLLKIPSKARSEHETLVWNNIYGHTIQMDYSYI